MSEQLIRKTVLAFVLSGFVVGIIAYFMDVRIVEPSQVWTISTLPVIATLGFSIIRDLRAGRMGVDLIALISMIAALFLGETLAAIVVAIMYAGGTALEDFARGRAERSLTALVDRSPRVAHRKGGEEFETIHVDQVAVGDELLVQSGELLPVDGILRDDSALIDEAAVTGEPLPRRFSSGDQLHSGTINAGEAFLMQATASAEASTYAGIVHMVTAAQTAKAPFIRLADRFAIWMLPFTLILSGLAWYFSGDPVRALAVLVIATPCPLILAAPVAFIGGLARAARAGIMIKGSPTLEALDSIKVAFFHKTGTLTEGGAHLVDTATAPDRNPDDILRLLASLEQASQHVLADHITAIARAKGSVLSTPENVIEHRGSGMEGIVERQRLCAGTRELVSPDALPLWAEAAVGRFEKQPVLRVYVSLNGELVAVFTFGDAIRPDANATLVKLRSLGLSRLIMITGDDYSSASPIAKALGIDTVIAKASPAEKLDAINAEKNTLPVMMIGDGLNDAPALAAATVGVAMGVRGATASSQAADIVILGEKLHPVAEAVTIARRTRSIALQSILFGLGLSCVGMIAAAFGLIPPLAGALFQEAIDIAVILNALRTLRAPS